MTAPILPTPADRVEIVSVIDNAFDLLLDEHRCRASGSARVRPTGYGCPSSARRYWSRASAWTHRWPSTVCHLLISVTSGDTRRTLLFDTGSSVGALAHNLRALNVDPTAIEAIVLSHGHFDHTMGLQRPRRHPPSAAASGRAPRRVAASAGGHSGARALGITLDERGKDPCRRVSSGVEMRQPSALLGGGIVVTGEIERTTQFEHGLPVHEAFRDGEWQADPLLHDDQALVANVRGKGLVVITGCSHAGVINTVRYARKITGVDRVHAVLGGFHLAGPLYEHSDSGDR